MYKALTGGEYPKTFKPTEESEFDQALRQARETITETAWEWEHILWLTATSPAEYLKLEKATLTELARTRLYNLYNA